MKKYISVVLLIILSLKSYSFANEPINCNSKEANALVISAYNDLLKEALTKTFDINGINTAIDKFLKEKEYKPLLAVMPIYLLFHLKITVVTNKEVAFDKTTHSRTCLAELKANYDEALWRKYIDQLPRDMFKTDPNKSIANIANNFWSTSNIQYTLEVTNDQKSIIKTYDFVGEPLVSHGNVKEPPSLLHLLKI